MKYACFHVIGCWLIHSLITSSLMPDLSRSSFKPASLASFFANIWNLIVPGTNRRPPKIGKL